MFKVWINFHFTIQVADFCYYGCGVSTSNLGLIFWVVLTGSGSTDVIFLQTPIPLKIASIFDYSIFLLPNSNSFTNGTILLTQI